MRSSLPTFGLETLERLLATLSNLPIGVHGGAFLALLAGIAVWLFGVKALKPVFALVGMALGSILGALALPLLGVMQVGSFPSVYVGLAAGGVAGLIGACLLFRFALIVASGIVFAALGVLVAAAYVDHRNPGSIQPPSRLLLGAPAERPETNGPKDSEPKSYLVTRDSQGVESAIMAQQSEAAVALVKDALPAVQKHAESARAFANELGGRVSTEWNAIGTNERLVLCGGGIAGAVLGVLFGIAMPKRSGALVTALFGASIVAVSTVWLAGAMEISGAALMDQPPKVIAFGLGVATLVGMAIQLTLTNKRAGGAKATT
ncbi:MAG: hypothetical protein KF902_02060 [Phycisphaeraceae bacterium]|nr:hypothetical protein [Phycisphaeraceae bacterium]